MVYTYLVFDFLISCDRTYWTRLFGFRLSYWSRKLWHHWTCCWCEYDGICKYGADCLWSSLQVARPNIYCCRVSGEPNSICKPWCLHGFTDSNYKSSWALKSKVKFSFLTEFLMVINEEAMYAVPSKIKSDI